MLLRGASFMERFFFAKVNMEKHRIHYIFSGDVQGVGFRSAACWKARELGITGWVKNIYDGTVEMEAQGTLAELAALVEGLRHQLFIMVENIQSREIPVIDEEGFHIR